MAEAAAKPYYETSLERSAYLWTKGIKPIGGKWTENVKRQVIYMFEYKQTKALADALMKYKGSDACLVLGIFTSLFHRRGKYIKHLDTKYPLEEETAFLYKFLQNYEPSYE